MDLGRLGQRIKQQREKRQLRQADIASALRLTAQAVSKWERGENAPDIAVLVDLARLLGVSVEWILTGRQEAPGTFPAVVLCTSLNGFAERAARVPPADLAAWSNTIHYAVTEAVLRFDGVPVKCVGDGFLGFFAGPDQADRALHAARQAKGLFELPDLVVVLHAGEIFLGSAGHPDYARTDIMGHTVNTAFLAMPFVAAHCPGGIGVTQAFVDQLPPGSAPVERGRAGIPGLAEPLAIYEVRIDRPAAGRRVARASPATDRVARASRR
ncbi:MAG TPA: helix-turn-helix domain-containing protein [Vicinamibacterales bacterium]|jgi:class 3 adenylate cyclase